MTPMRQAGDPEPHARCGAACRAGHPCPNPPMKGARRCRMHGSATQRARVAAVRELARAEWAASFGEPAADADPVETVLDEIRWSRGHVGWLREWVQDTAPEALVWGVASRVTRRSGEFPGVDVTQAARVSVWVEMYGAERDRLVRMCKVAADMGIAERQIELAERVGDVIADVLRGVVDELGLSEAQQIAAGGALVRHLALAAGQLTGGSDGR